MVDPSIATVALARGMRREMTAAEPELWGLLRARRLAGLKFRRQHPMGAFVADFYCCELALVIEVDGGVHAKAEVREYDSQRSAYLRSAGLTVLRFSNDDVLRRPADVCRYILACAESIKKRL